MDHISRWVFISPSNLMKAYENYNKRLESTWTLSKSNFAPKKWDVFCVDILIHKRTCLSEFVQKFLNLWFWILNVQYGLFSSMPYCFNTARSTEFRSNLKALHLIVYKILLLSSFWSFPLLLNFYLFMISFFPLLCLLLFLSVIWGGINCKMWFLLKLVN